MSVVEDLLLTISDKEVVDVTIGLHWTAVTVMNDGVKSCGLASTLSSNEKHDRIMNVPDAGDLEHYSGLELAGFANSNLPTMRSVGVAAINAMLQPNEARLYDSNAEQILAAKGKNKRVVVVGRFPFLGRLKEQVGNLVVLEKDPGMDDLPESAAPDVLPYADVVAITGMTVINHTLESLLDLCSSHAYKMILGPSTPLSPIFDKYGIDVLSGSLVTSIDAVVKVIRQGGNFRQIHKSGIKLVNYFISKNSI
jgi:uncharacterized protein (DUF4213/DUF364 family)